MAGKSRKLTADAVEDVVLSIPAGRVMAYGDVARAAGSPRGARTVAWILHSSSAARALPWHRVVAKGGKISLGDSPAGVKQRARLKREGVGFDEQGRVEPGFFWAP